MRTSHAACWQARVHPFHRPRRLFSDLILRRTAASPASQLPHSRWWFTCQIPAGLQVGQKIWLRATKRCQFFRKVESFESFTVHFQSPAHYHPRCQSEVGKPRLSLSQVTLQAHVYTRSMQLCKNQQHRADNMMALMQSTPITEFRKCRSCHARGRLCRRLCCESVFTLDRTPGTSRPFNRDKAISSARIELHHVTVTLQSIMNTFLHRNHQKSNALVAPGAPDRTRLPRVRPP